MLSMPTQSDTVKLRWPPSVWIELSRPSTSHRLIVFVETPSSSAASDIVRAKGIKNTLNPDGVSFLN